MGRLTKQLVIGFIYLALIGGIGYGAYDLFTPDASCSDGIRNQGEDGVDCGTVCGVLCASALRPLEVAEPEVYSADGTTDVLVAIENPNAIYGASRIDYELVLTDDAGERVSSRRGFTYGNPLETRYLVNSFPGVNAADVDVSFIYEPDGVAWLQADREFPGVTFSFVQEQFTVASESVRYSAVIRNGSTFNFDEVDVSVMLLDASGNTVGIGATVVRTLPAAGVRAFTVDWPFAVAPRPVRARAFGSTNVFSNANYIREYGAQERFQGF
ncbi:MAG TPA: FxLYD domain-containing protein [Candidatus Paceibacterota bacterium]|nr:FxLYD domain-containing protein [Candidatus Paceibacterota bacterium]